ncbi:hypothetical protein ACXR2U_01035 [Jatrophihabitans sp. YIM 134969]
MTDVVVERKATGMDTSGMRRLDRQVITIEQVADLLQTVHAANARVAAELDLVVGSRASVSQTTVERLARLADELEPGAVARTELAGLEPGLLMDGTWLWMQRSGASESTARARAAALWTGGQCG